MTHAMTLMQLLIKRGPLSANQMVKATGMTLTQVRKAMHSLRVRGALQGMDRPYRITPVGRSLAVEREARAKRLAGKTAQPKQPIGRPKKKFDSVMADSFVRRAVRKQPALQAAWGVMA